ncbi:hypothetical protein [Niabella aurantiaca]|uniref:hypothetical protein n=1 Tax=Niabella aurantiaca TaxID=379900 RepID=UPI0003683CB3|nr:hypothetical protein [Niabella aurantiaca]
MRVEKTKHQTIFTSFDDQGDYKVTIQNDCSQVQVTVAIDEDDPGEEVYFNVNRKELTAIRDMINQVLEY